MNSVNERAMMAIMEKNFVRICEERDEFRSQLIQKSKLVNDLVRKLADLEKKCEMSLVKEEKTNVEIDILLKEKQELEGSIRNLTKQKSVVVQQLDSEKFLLTKVWEERKARRLIQKTKLVEDESVIIEELKMDKEKKVVEDQRDLEEKAKNDLQKEVDCLDVLVCTLNEDVADLEKKCVMSSEKEPKTSIEIDILLKEKQEFEARIQKLVKAKSEREANIVKLNEELNKFKNSIAAHESKLRELESEVRRYKTAQANLDGEKLKVKNLSEKMDKEKEEMGKKVSKMQKDNEKHVEEKKKLEKDHAELKNDILVVNKSLARARKEHDDTKGKLKASEANMCRILKNLKNFIMGINEETGEKKHHVKEVEAIKKAFRDKEDEMKKQIELLKVSVAKADKGKRFCTMVSSATTILAVVSLAYVAL